MNNYKVAAESSCKIYRCVTFSAMICPFLQVISRPEQTEGTYMQTDTRSMKHIIIFFNSNKMSNANLSSWIWILAQTT